jgi:hypothetical protein
MATDQAWYSGRSALCSGYNHPPMKRYPPTQDDVIGAFLRWVNADRGAAYDVAKRPDEANRNEQDIDYVLTDPKRTPEIAVEVSSVWRSEEAGKEDAFFAKWFGRVRTRVQGRVAGTFYVFFSPIRVPDRLDPERFGNDLLGVMEREAEGLAAAGREGKGLLLDVQGIRIQLHRALPHGSDIDYGRFKPDTSQFPDRVRTLLAEKAPKLKRYKDDGLETWIVAYNTAWTIMSPVDVQRIVSSLLGPDHRHVDHVGICAGDPPGDATIFVIR